MEHIHQFVENETEERVEFRCVCGKYADPNEIPL